MRIPTSRHWRAIALITAVAASVPWTRADSQPAEGEWLQYADPAEAGFSVSELDAARRYADSVRSGAVMVLHRGRVVAAWGDVRRKFGLHSVRKSLVSALYGTGVSEGRIDLDATLAQLGIDDRMPLTPTEQAAKIRDIIAARSGVYLPAAYAGSDQDADRPPRGSHPPGTFWFYNNWDFNIAGVIYEKLTGEKLYESFNRRIAQQIGMQDYQVTDGLEVLEPSGSMHPAHTFRMSTRDLARFGQLYLQRGNWNGKQIVPASWIQQSTTAISETGPGGQGYGFMWWVYPADSAAKRYPSISRHALYQARGTGGQVMYVIPDADLVIVLRGDTDNNRNVGGGASWTIAERIVVAKKTDPSSKPRLVALSSLPFQSQAPAPPEPSFVKLSRAQLEQFVGEYTIGADAIARVTMYDGRLFMYFPGQGEAELFATGTTEFTIRVINGVFVKFTSDPAGRVSGVEATLGRQTMSGPRVVSTH